MKVYVINLDRSPERLVHMDKQLRALGVQYERVSAVDGRRLPPDPAHPLSVTLRGNLMSHQLVWRRIADGQDPYAIVLEDDIHIAPAFSQFAQSGDWVPGDASAVKFGTNLKKVSFDRDPHGTFHGISVHRLRTAHAGADAYLISREIVGALRAGPGCLDRFSASISGASTGVMPPCGWAAG